VSAVPGRFRAWDLPTRLFHWTLVVLVVFSFTTGKIGGSWLEWHMKSGFAILALLLFRLAWGVVGTTTSRFASFVRGPRAAITYARETMAGRHPFSAGHNPLGGWMVVFMLAILLAQAVTGLFVDNEIDTQAPLTVKVSNAVVSKMSAYHHYNQWIIAGMVILHLAAVATYQWRFKVDLIGPMAHGWREVPAELRPPEHRTMPAALAAVIIAVAAAFVYWLVIVFPKG